MAKWFEDNPVGLALASVCGVLLLIVLVLTVVWSLPAPELDEDDLDATVLEALVLPELGENEPLESYAVIAQRPVFSENRRPPILMVDSEGLDEPEEEEEIDAPEVTLSGVVITPDARMVTLKHKDHPESLIAFEGQPLEGEFGSWHVSRIGERDITLSSGDGEDIDLKLEVNKAAMSAPEIARAARESETADVSESEEVAAAGDEGGEQLSRAEEIRQRIAERREELRRAAEEQQENPEEQQQQQSYSSAIQNMIKRRPEKDQNENQK